MGRPTGRAIGMRAYNELYLGSELKHRDVKIVDSTLREGGQAAGVAFKPEEKLRIALYDDEIGIDLIEMFAPYSENDTRTLRLIGDAGLARSELLLWNRLRKGDIDLSLRHDPDWIAVCVGFSDVHLSKKLRRSRGEVIDDCVRCVDYVHDHGVKVSLHMEDSTRTRPEYLEEAIGRIDADKFRDCDTVSVLVPQAAYHRLRHLTGLTSRSLEVHYHNDLGMAVANSISAVMGGASWISATWNGLGERAGNAPIEEVLLILEELYGVGRFDLSRMTEVCEFVSRASRVPIPRYKPVTGRDIFSVQSGIHQNGLLKGREIYQPYAPEIVGRRWRIVIGATSGRSGLEHVLRSEFGHRLPGDKEKQLEILRWARKRAVEAKRCLNEGDIREMIRLFKLPKV